MITIKEPHLIIGILKISVQLDAYLAIVDGEDHAFMHNLTNLIH
jgi:hypothetical protein